MDSMPRSHGHDARAGLGRLAEVLAGIAATAEARCRTRCPHRDARNRCTYPGACSNQVGAGRGSLVCGGDRHLRFEPPAPAPPQCGR